jgi:hypothetical protein
MDRRVCERCDTDANCMEADTFCVPMRRAGRDRPGGYCLKASSNGCERPFSVATAPRTTLSGVRGKTFCGINETLATCEAVRALIDDRACPGGTDAECPEGGVCSDVGVLSNRCTYRCAFATDCLPPPSPASSCGLSAAMRDYCGG